MTRIYHCLYLGRCYVPNTYPHSKYLPAFCWIKPPHRRTLNVCQNCLLACKVNGFDDPRTPRLQVMPRWAKEAAT